MRLFYSLVVLLSAVAFVAAAPYPKQLGQNDVAVANKDLRPLTSAQLKTTKRNISARFRAVARRRDTKKRAAIPGSPPMQTDPGSENAPEETGRNRPVSKSSPEETGRTRPVSNTSPGEGGRTRPASNTGTDAAEAPPEEDEDKKGVKKHKRPPPKKQKKKKKQPKPKKDKDEESNTDDTGSDDDPGTDNLSENASGTDRD